MRIRDLRGLFTVEIKPNYKLVTERASEIASFHDLESEDSRQAAIKPIRTGSNRFRFINDEEARR